MIYKFCKCIVCIYDVCTDYDLDFITAVNKSLYSLKAFDFVFCDQRRVMAGDTEPCDTVSDYFDVIGAAYGIEDFFDNSLYSII